MFDLRIIIAVLLTLWGLAIGMANGVVDLHSVSSFSISDLGTQLPFFNSQTEIPIHATFTTTKVPTFNKYFTKPLPDLLITYVSNSSSLLIKGAQVSFNTNTVTFEALNYKGTLNLGETSIIDGNADRLKINNLTFRDVSIQSGPVQIISVKIMGAPASNYQMEKASGSVISSGTTITMDNKPISILSFTGNMDFLLDNNTYVFDGKITKLYSAGTPVLSLNN